MSMVCSWGAFRTKWSLNVVFLPLFCKMNTLSGIKFIAEDSSVKNETLLLKYANLDIAQRNVFTKWIIKNLYHFKIVR